MFQGPIALNLPNSDISYYPKFLDALAADRYFKDFRATVPWQQDTITVFGKTYQQPRLTALFGENGKSYTYSNIVMQPHPFSGNLLKLKSSLEKRTALHFTTCLMNLYRHGKDSNGWHSDDEKELGTNPVIASVSLGQERFFHLRHTSKKNLKHKLLLEHGSLLLMKGETQHFWQHQIPKTSRTIKERINLTFRIIQ